MDQSFESAFERLEQILEKMNTGKTPLDESLKLFEEADQLIRFCTRAPDNRRTKSRNVDQEPQN